MTEHYKRKSRALLHIYNRGNRRQHICLDLKDFALLHYLIKSCFTNSNYDLLTFCIMPNHFHILLKQQGNLHIGSVMQRLGSTYTKSFNMKYAVSGHLFQGTYKCKIINNRTQLETVSKYIIANPQEINLPLNYPYLFNNQTLLDYYLLSEF